MADEFQSINIAISGVEDTGNQVKIRDQNKRTYSFFKNKKDGEPTVAFQDFQHFKIGDTALVTYKEVPYRDGTIRNVINFREPTGPPEQAPITAVAQYRARTNRRGEEKPGREYWERREAKRQSSILMQVAFKSAVALEAARIRSGRDEDRQRVFDDTTEFYDWMEGQIGQAEENLGEQGQARERQEQLSAEEELGF